MTRFFKYQTLVLFPNQIKLSSKGIRPKHHESHCFVIVQRLELQRSISRDGEHILVWNSGCSLVTSGIKVKLMIQ